VHERRRTRFVFRPVSWYPRGSGDFTFLTNMQLQHSKIGHDNLLTTYFSFATSLKKVFNTDIRKFYILS
jgi:hypothetical protein